MIPMYISFALVFSFVALTIIISLKYTHKIYGPLLAINRFLDEVLKGETPKPLKLRDGDQLQDLANKLNAIQEQKKDGNG